MALLNNKMEKNNNILCYSIKDREDYLERQRSALNLDKRTHARINYGMKCASLDAELAKIERKWGKELNDMLLKFHDESVREYNMQEKLLATARANGTAEYQKRFYTIAELEVVVANLRKARSVHEQQKKQHVQTMIENLKAKAEALKKKYAESLATCDIIYDLEIDTKSIFEKNKEKASTSTDAIKVSCTCGKCREVVQLSVSDLPAFNLSLYIDGTYVKPQDATRRAMLKDIYCKKCGTLLIFPMQVFKELVDFYTNNLMQHVVKQMNALNTLNNSKNKKQQEVRSHSETLNIKGTSNISFIFNPKIYSSCIRPEIAKSISIVDNETRDVENKADISTLLQQPTGDSKAKRHIADILGNMKIEQKPVEEVKVTEDSASESKPLEFIKEESKQEEQKPIEAPLELTNIADVVNSVQSDNITSIDNLVQQETVKMENYEEAKNYEDFHLMQEELVQMDRGTLYEEYTADVETLTLKQLTFKHKLYSKAIIISMNDLDPELFDRKTTLETLNAILDNMDDVELLPKALKEAYNEQFGMREATFEDLYTPTFF